MSAGRPIRIGTRASPLARWQAQWVANSLAATGCPTTLVPITTRGDKEQSTAVEEIGTRGIFTKELQHALLDEQIDVAVHSLKDLPTEAVAGLALAAVPERESPLDVLATRDGRRLAALGSGARVGTGSLRRQSQLLHRRPDLAVAPVRGNVDTRLRKLDEGHFDALVLAQAGLNRLGLSARAAEVLSAEQMLPAIGQGALGLEVREADQATRSALAALDHWPTRAAVLAERSLLESLEGGCLAPIGGLATALVSAGELRLEGVVLSRDGAVRLYACDDGAIAIGDERAACSIPPPQFDAAIDLGRRVAARLLEQGAAALIRAARWGSA